MNTRSALMLTALACLGTATGSLGIRAYQQLLEEDHDQEPKVPNSPRTDSSIPITTRQETIDDVVSSPIMVMEPTVIEVKRSSAPAKQPSPPAYRQQQLPQLVQDTIAYTQRTGNCAFVARKLERLLDVYCNGQLAHQLRMNLGFDPVSDKTKQGDGATPEGRYHVQAVKNIGQTDFYRAFLIDYPNKRDWREFREAKRSGLIPKDASIGGEIEIHGRGGRRYDWTRGCMAVRNEEMDVLFDYVKRGMIGKGTPVAIVPSSSGSPFTN